MQRGVGACTEPASRASAHLALGIRARTPRKQGRESFCDGRARGDCLPASCEQLAGIERGSALLTADGYLAWVEAGGVTVTAGTAGGSGSGCAGGGSGSRSTL